MGVDAGWKAFDDAVVRTSIGGEFANAKAGVDANIWIHQGWAMRKTGSVQDKLDSSVETVISRATKLVNAGVFPVLVFDGARTAHKKETHAKRAGTIGEKFERCYLPRILNEVRKRGFVYVVAPNESDHQLKYMESSGLVDFVLTDDTDAVVLGCAKVVHKVSWSVSTLKCNVFNRNNLRMPVDTNEVNTVAELMCMHGDAAMRLWAAASGCDYREGKVPGLGPQTALKAIVACIQSAETLSIRSFVKYLVKKDVVDASDEDTQILKLEESLAGFERAIVYDMRTKERRWLNDATIFNANHSENEEFALGLRDADTHEPVELVAVAALFRHGETRARRIPKYLIKGAVLPEKRVEDNSKSDLIRWLNVRRNDRRRGCQDIRDKDVIISEVIQRMELERRYEELDIDVDVDVQDPEGKSLHTYLVHHFHLPVTQFPELDPDLDAPMDAEVWSTDVELFRETSPLMGEDIITTWLAGMSVYGDPVRSNAYRQGYARIHARTPLPIRFAHVGHPWMQTHFRVWFRVGIPASLKAERYAVAVCLLCKYGCIDEETNEHVHDHVVSVERGTCACKAGAGGDFGGCIHVIAALWYFAKLQRPADPCTSLESEWFGTSGEGDPMNRKNPLSNIDFNRFEAGRAKRRCTVDTRGDGDLELPEVAPDVSAMWSRNKPSTLLREYFDVYEKENNHKCTLHRVTDACETRNLP